MRLYALFPGSPGIPNPESHMFSVTLQTWQKVLSEVHPTQLFSALERLQMLENTHDIFAPTPKEFARLAVDSPVNNKLTKSKWLKLWMRKYHGGWCASLSVKNLTQEHVDSEYDKYLNNKKDEI